MRFSAWVRQTDTKPVTTNGAEQTGGAQQRSRIMHISQPNRRRVLKAMRVFAGAAIAVLLVDPVSTTNR